MRVNASMRVLKRVNGGVGQGQRGHWLGSMGVLNNGGSMGALVRVNGGVGQGQWGHGEGSGQGLGFGGCGCGSDRGVAVGQTGGCLTGL